MAMNSPEYITVYYACAKLGATFVPLNFRAKQEELVYMVNQADAKVLFTGERYLPLVEAIRDQITTVQHYVSIDAKVDGMPFVQELMAAAGDDEVYTRWTTTRHPSSCTPAAPPPCPRAWSSPT